MLGIEENYIVGFKLQSQAIEEAKLESPKKLLRHKSNRASNIDSDKDEYDSEDEEEGQVQIPKDIIRDVAQL